MNLHAKMMLNEKLDYIAQGETLEDQIERTKAVAKIDQTFAPFMRMAVLENERIFGLPEGMPETYKPETDIPDGISFSTARQEFRRIRNFMADGPMKNVPSHQREIKWVQMLEGMHWKESNILVHIKDQTLLDIYPNMREVLTSLGADIKLPEKKKTTRKSKKS
jgi:hypothetical protein